MTTRSLLPAGTLASLLLFLTSAASAQELQRQNLKTSGTLQGMQPGLLNVSEGGNPWLVKIQKETMVTVTGTAEEGFLHPGLYVRFNGEFTAKGKATGEIAELEIFTPQAPSELGVMPASMISGAAASEETETTSSAATPAKTKAKGPQTSTYTVAGQITAYKKGKMTVNAGGQSVKVVLADAAPITVNSADYSVASQGDAVEIVGWYTQTGQAYAEEVSITLSNPLTGPKKGRGIKKPAKTAVGKEDEAETTGFGAAKEGAEEKSAFGAADAEEKMTDDEKMADKEGGAFGASSDEDEAMEEETEVKKPLKKKPAAKPLKKPAAKKPLKTKAAAEEMEEEASE